MTGMIERIKSLYFALTLKQPVVTLVLVTILVGGLALYMDQFRLDASADSLVLENDADLRYYRSIRARYEPDDFLFITYSPKNGKDIMSDEILDDIRTMRDDLREIARVESVISLLDVPLIDSPRTSLGELQKQVRTLETADTDRELARKEFLNSPLYTNLIMSPDGKTTALQVNFKRDQTYQRLLKERSALREKQLVAPLSQEQQLALEKVSQEFKDYSALVSEQESKDIATVRSILDKHRDKATIFLGGVPMVVSDMIDYIGYDIETFGIGVISFIILLLSFSFKRIRWVFLPVLICVAASLGMIGFLGLMQWQVTVVSSNFISLLLIITLSLTVHLIVRFQELHAENPEAKQLDLIKETMRSKAVPSIYTSVTTMVAFGSLLVSGIRPVIDFGWMMVCGIGFGLIIAMLVFPAGLSFLRPGKPIHRGVDLTGHFTEFLADTIAIHPKKTFTAFMLLAAVSVFGINMLTVENRFIDYFKSNTEIFQGMLVIDQQMGGTTPLEVILDPDQDFFENLKAAQEEEFDDGFSTESSSGVSGSSFWFNIFELENVTKVHNYLDQQPQIGKVLSLSSTMAMLTKINGDEPLDNLSLSVMYKRLPEDVKKALFDPYMASDGNQVRLSVRVIDSDKNLLRDELLKKIKTDLVEKLGLFEEQVHLTGMVVLYNNMLQSLFRSQILTIGVVFLAIFLMFVVLFRSFYISLLAIIPNIISAGTVLGLMGILRIPLDMMTITIAAITIGIAVDDTIHYVHRFREEFAVDRDYWAAIKRCHKSIGRAMYYTSITIALGFSILSLSNFIPTIYFGLFTGFAMLVAMVANLTLLPVLIALFKPEGSETKEETSTSSENQSASSPA